MKTKRDLHGVILSLLSCFLRGDTKSVKRAFVEYTKCVASLATANEALGVCVSALSNNEWKTGRDGLGSSMEENS